MSTDHVNFYACEVQLRLAYIFKLLERTSFKYCAYTLNLNKKQT